MTSIKYAQNGKRDFHNLEEEFDQAFEELHNEEWKIPENKDALIDYLKACKRGKTKSAGKNRKVGKSSLYRIMGILRLFLEEWIGKDIRKVTREDVAKFYDAMEDDEIKQSNGKAYKQSSKSKNYKTIRKFMRWVGKGDYCDDWDVTEEVPTKEFLSRNEVERLVNSAGIQYKAHIMILFDGGLRAEEYGNLRWKDLKKKDGKKYYQAHVRKETSKTKKERFVSLWLATDYIDSLKTYQKEKLGAEFNEEGFLYNGMYQSLLRQIKRLGKQVLNKHITPHMLRHSSATYYANVIKTYQNFCYRYGWSLNSSTPQRYWHPQNDDEVAEQAKEHEIAKFKTQFEQVKLRNDALQQHLEKLEKTMDGANAFFAMASKNPKVLKVLVEEGIIEED